MLGAILNTHNPCSNCKCFNTWVYNTKAYLATISPDCTAGISISSAVPELWKTYPGPFRQSSDLYWSLMTQKNGKNRPAAFRQKPVLYRPPIYTKVYYLICFETYASNKSIIG